MAMLADLLKEVLASMPKKYQSFGNKDRRAELPQLPSTEGDSAGKTMKPAEMQMGQRIAKDPKNIYNDAGQIVDYDLGKLDATDPITKFLKDKMTSIGQRVGEATSGGTPFSSLLSAPAEQGTMRNFLSRMFSDTPVADQPGAVVGRGTISPPSQITNQPADPAAFDAKPMKDQAQPALAPGRPTPTPLADQPPSPPPADYSMPNALDPQQIEELRNSILSQTQQMNPNYPDGLSGRMNSPYSHLDQEQQMQDAERQARQLNANKNY